MTDFFQTETLPSHSSTLEEVDGMPVQPLRTLTCPIDGSDLTQRDASLACPRGHTFDRAREGYVNLLPVQDKASKDPGDSKEMVAARRRFLDSGAYAPIARAVAAEATACLTMLPGSSNATVLDAGCGEGYYLHHLAEHFAKRPGNVELAGIDISKWAVRAAAKRSVPVTWAVATNRRPPLQQGSVDLILCLFGFAVWKGFAELQRPGGHVLMVDPGPDHLQELRSIIYPQVRRTPRAEVNTDGLYRLASETHARESVRIPTKTLIADLLSMTPHAHRATAEGRARLAALDTLDVTIDVCLSRFARV